MRMSSYAGWLERTEVCRLVGTNLRREVAHARNFQFKIPTKSVRMRGFLSQICANQPANLCTGNFKSIVLKSRRESAHAHTFGRDFELKIVRMRGFSSRFWTMDLKFPVVWHDRPLMN